MRLVKFWRVVPRRHRKTLAMVCISILDCFSNIVATSIHRVWQILRCQTNVHGVLLSSDNAFSMFWGDCSLSA